MRINPAIVLSLLAVSAVGGIYPPAAGQPGSTAIAYNDPGLVAWGSFNGQITRGQKDISDPGGPLVTFGNPVNAVKAADAITPETLTDPERVVSLGDGGSITLMFNSPIFDGPAWDFAVFENAFNDGFLELAFVEVFDGDTWARFPTHSQTQAAVQIDQVDEFNDELDPTNLDGFAGKYRAGFGTPFDLSILDSAPGLDINHIIAVRIEDVVGCIDPEFARRDSANNVINDFWPTPFDFGGFDLDAIGAFHVVPEPGTGAAILMSCLGLGLRRRRT
jgi:hypothetical protein